MRRHKLNQGFTLIELLIVIAIIALIAMVGVGNLITSQRRARDAKRIADLKAIANAQEQYYTPTQGYDITLGDGIGTIMPKLPRDPSGPNYIIRRPGSPNQSAAYCITSPIAFEESNANANCTGCPDTCVGNNCVFNTGTNDRFCITNQQ